MNLYYTDGVSKSDNVFEHNCLRVIPDIDLKNDPIEIIYYCMNELSSKFNIETNDLFPKLTFNDLAKQNITSKELYLWSTPIDIIERYQFYLNELLTLNNLSLGKEIFYNCTKSRFGPKCEYEFDYNSRDYSSLYEMLRDFYDNNRYDPTSLTCYTHLKCSRGPYPLCLDWSEICNGQIDCLDGGFDEEHCWQLEINECKENEYRCNNGQCIPKLFYRDTLKISDCIDGSDEVKMYGRSREVCYVFNELPFGCESMTCKRTPLTNSCVEKRVDLLMEMMYSIKDNSVSKDCWTAFKCLIKFSDSEYSFCNNLCKQNACIEIVNKTCPNVLYFPNVPVLFGDIYFIYTKNDLFQYLTSSSDVSFNICYNKSDYDDYFVNISTRILFNNMICIHSESLLSRLVHPTISSHVLYPLYHDNIFKLYEVLKRYHLIYNYTSTICKKWNMYQCLDSSKCISIYRLMDTIYDCPNMDDEDIIIINNNTILIEHFKNNYFKCEKSVKYIPQSLIKNDFCDCINIESGWCEDEDLEVNYIKKNILFQHICDGFIDLIPIKIGERNETDETECDQWQCNNIYTRCNKVWNCPNGADESGCGSFLKFNCSFNYHLCVSPRTNQLMCLPIEKANDGNVDCLGATDEPKLCGTNIQSNFHESSYDFYCMNQKFKSCILISNLCDGYKQCEHGDDEQFCTTNRTSHTDSSVCLGLNYVDSSRVEKFLCDYRVPSRTWQIEHFTLDEMSYFIEDQSKNMENSVFSSSSMIKMSNKHQHNCHHGLSLRVWLNNKNNLTKTTCLCSSNFYGSECQYQNERINVIIKFRALSDSWETLFAIVILLIDDSNERIIHSYEQFTYLSMRDCQHKFSIYLLYSTRPKNLTKTYSIHIDIYEKVSLDYRGSLLLPVTFPFLPFQRLAFVVDIPRTDNNNDQSCLNDKCIHGKCIKYSNKPENESFCQCNQGWSGRYCTIQYNSTCSSDSLCIGISAINRSICVCPMNKFGSRCFLVDRICQNNLTCQNGGQCIPNDNYMILDKQFSCICPKGFNGQLCQFADNKLILSFEKDIILSQEMFIHFFDVSVKIRPDEHVVRSTTFHPITIKQDSVIIYWSQPFNIIFIEFLNKNYYLISVQKNYNQSSTIIKKINLSDRCPHINELFNKTFIELHLIHRIKSYHFPCQNRSLNLSCFYDDIHLCLCYDFGKERLANCLNFNHNMTFDCLGQSECENNGQCLQDTPYCPQKSICICSLCFYGRRCQFSTSVFGLSLDAIIGLNILPDVHLIHQPFIIKMSLILTIIFTILGLINGIFSIITFKNKIVREIGCGFYLIGSSINTLLIIIIFAFKFGILILAQMTIISSRSFLLFQCYLIDFILQVCLNMNQWLNACVAIERAITSIKGTNFNKKKSRKAAKFIIIILFILILVTFIHDPIYRRLIDEINDDNHIKRIWCIVSYRSKLQVYNSIMQIFHFSVPFLMNLISVVILIREQTHQQATIHPQRTYREHFRSQFHQNKQLLIGPIVLVILALPRLIISFLSKCMKSTNDSWLFLTGYFISFIPSMLTFLVFIIPSKFYKKLFWKSIQKYRIIIQRYLQILS